MFHYSEQWNIKEERDALLNPNASFIGDKKILKKPSFQELENKGVSIRRTLWHRGVNSISNYGGVSETNKWREYRAYHYFCSEYHLWCTEYYVLTYP